jgi:hypothetical protein
VPAQSWSSSGICSKTQPPGWATSDSATTPARIDTARKIRNHIRQLEALGYAVILSGAA